MKLKFLRKLFKKRLKVVRLSPGIQIDDEAKKMLEEDIKRIFPNPIRHGNRRRERRAYGRVASLPLTWKHREDYDWLYDDDRKKTREGLRDGGLKMIKLFKKSLENRSNGDS